MKFVLKFWCVVWVCEIDAKWIVDDENICSKHAYAYTLHFSSKMVVVVVVDESHVIIWTVAVAIVRCCHCWIKPWKIIIMESCQENGSVHVRFAKNGSIGVFELETVLA